MNILPRYGAGTLVTLVLIAGATGPTHARDTMKGQPVGVPLAHWSEGFSFAIQFSAPVAAIAGQPPHPPEAIVKAVPDNSEGTRWRLRVRPSWSADARIRVG